MRHLLGQVLANQILQESRLAFKRRRKIFTAVWRLLSASVWNRSKVQRRIRRGDYLGFGDTGCRE